MNGLSLCSGVGGLDLALHQAVESYRTVCYVELDLFCQDILCRRMDDGRLDRAPIWPDLRTFDGTAWRGVVDLVSAGFPCQPFSVAGQRKGADDARNLWPDVARVIGECRPAVVFLENVPGALPYFFHVVLPELSSLGYTAQTRLVTAAETGAPHRRQRVFVLAHRQGSDWSLSILRRGSREASDESGGRGASLATTEGDGLEGRPAAGTAGFSRSEYSGLPPWPPGPGERDEWATILAHWPELAPAVADARYNRPRISSRQRENTAGIGSQSGADDSERSGGSPQPEIRLLADGLPAGLAGLSRVDKLKALGNAVVPDQAALAFRLLWAEVERRMNGR